MAVDKHDDTTSVNQDECTECHDREDYTGEMITHHCNKHCPNVLNGNWTECRGC